MNSANSVTPSKLRKIIPIVELIDPMEIAKLEARHKGKLYWIMLPDLPLERTGGGTTGQYSYPNAKIELCSGREFGVSSNEAMWIKFIFSDALKSSLLAAHTPVRVKKHVYNPVARSYQLVVYRYTAKSFRDTLINIASEHRKTEQDLRRILQTRNPWA